MTKSSCQEDAAFKEIPSFCGEASGRNWGGLQREWTGREEGREGGGRRRNPEGGGQSAERGGA